MDRILFMHLFVDGHGLLPPLAVVNDAAQTRGLRVCLGPQPHSQVSSWRWGHWVGICSAGSRSRAPRAQSEPGLTWRLASPGLSPSFSWGTPP